MSSLSERKSISMRPPAPFRTMRTLVPRARRSRSSAARVWTSTGLGGVRFPRLWTFGKFPDQRLGFPHRQIAGDHVSRHAELFCLRRQREQRPGMAHRERAGRDVPAHFLGKLEQPQEIRDRRAILSDGLSDLFLCQQKLVGQTPVGERFIDGVQVFALDVFDERHLEERSIIARRDLPDHDRNFQETGLLRGAPTPLAGDDLKSFADVPDDDRLNDAVRFDRSREIVEARVIDVAARLERVGRESIDVEFNRPGARFRRGRDEGAQAFTESWAFFHSDKCNHEDVRAFVVSLRYAAVAADRSNISRARARYASAPRDLTS